MEEAITAIGMIAALYGIGDWMWRLVTFVLFSKRMSGEWVLISLHGDAEDAEFAVRRRLAARDRARCVLVDCGLTEQGKRLAERVSAAFSLPLCKADKLSEIVGNGLQLPADGV